MSHESYASLRSEVLALHDELAEIGPTGSVRRMLEGSRHGLSASCHVVVCGEFSRGKSSLLNALIDRPGLFPVDIDVTTSIITELRWGATETATIHVGDAAGDGEEPVTVRDVPLERLAEYVTERGNPGNSKGVRLVRLTAPVPLLRHGLVLVDTPGIGSLNIEHATATYAFLSKADAVLFVGAADERMSTAELSYLKDAIDKCPVVITVLTKIDKLFDPGPEVEVAVARDRIARLTGRPPREVSVVGVSSRRKREGFVTGDPERVRLSGFPELEETLSKRLAETWGATALVRSLDVLDDAVTALRAPWANEMTALGGTGALEAVRTEIADVRAEVDRLASGSAEWRSTLATVFVEATGPVRERLEEDCEQVEKVFLARADSDEALDDPHAFLRETAAALVDAVDRAYEALGDAADDAAAAVSDRTRLRIAEASVAKPGFQVSIDIPDVVLGPSPAEGRLKAALTSAAAGGGAGATLGAAIGGLIVPGVGATAGMIGLLIGHVVGMVTGLREHAEKARVEQRGKRRQVLESLVLPALKRKTDKALADFDQNVAAVQDQLLALFDEGIASTRESLAASAAALEDLRTATEQQRQRRRAELAGRLSRLDALGDRVRSLRTRVGTPG